MRIKFNENHLKGSLRDTVLTLNSKYNKTGETEFVIEDTDFSGRQLLELAKEGVEMDTGMRTFLKATPAFLDIVLESYTDETGALVEIRMRDYLAQHMTVETPEYVVVLLQANGSHLSGSEIIEFSQYGDILNMLEYELLVSNGAVEYSIELIADKWATYFEDYKQARKYMQERVTAIGFENLSDVEKRIVCEWFATSFENIAATLSIEEQDKYGNIFDAHSKTSRERRFSKVFNFFRTNLPTMQAIQVMGQFNELDPVFKKDLEYIYVKLGFEGKGVYNYRGEEDYQSILDFLRSTAGTRFATTGLAHMSLAPLNGLTVQELIDRACGIIING